MAFAVGDRVKIGGQILRGQTGTLVRPTHLLLNKARLVGLDDARVIRRTPVAERILEPLRVK
jgi:hypothetical protein